MSEGLPLEKGRHTVPFDRSESRIQLSINKFRRNRTPLALVRFCDEQVRRFQPIEIIVFLPIPVTLSQPIDAFGKVDPNKVLNDVLAIIYGHECNVGNSACGGPFFGDLTDLDVVDASCTLPISKLSGTMYGDTYRID